MYVLFLLPVIEFNGQGRTIKKRKWKREILKFKIKHVMYCPNEGTQARHTEPKLDLGLDLGSALNETIVTCILKCTNHQNMLLMKGVPRGYTYCNMVNQYMSALTLSLQSKYPKSKNGALKLARQRFANLPLFQHV